ncbi:uncharacterized protein RB166_015151 [Leptodactylus fuscus]
MSSNKFRRAYSLRIPRSPKPAAFLDSYDRLDETEAHDDYQGQKEASGKKDNSYSWEIPLITEAPKLHYCRKKWSSKSLRLPKSRQAEVEAPASQPEEVTQKEHDTYDPCHEPERPSSAEGRRLSSDSETQKETEDEGQKQKSKKMKQYKKTIDRAFRRGWDTFISNIYTISLTRTSQDAPQLIKAC